MGRYTVAVLAGCLYVIAASWIVSDQGRVHRDDLRRSREGRDTIAQPDPAPVAAENPAAPSPTAAEPPRPERNGGESAGETSIASAPERAPVRREPEPGPVAKAGPREPAGDVAPGPLTTNFAKAVGADVSQIRPVTADPFWERPAARKKWDTANLSAEDEMRLGADLNEMVLNFIPRHGSAAAQLRVEAAAKPILPARERADIDYKFFILDSKAINAFSHPGGYIYVTRGLLEWISEDETPALQFILAHEIFHVDRKHALECLRDPGLKQLPYSTLQLFYLFIIPRGYYPERMDFDADAWALQQLKKLQCTRRECMTFMRKLNGYAEAHDWGLDRTKALPRSGARESIFDNHLRAHPPTYQRLERLEALADQAFAKPR